MDNINGIPIKWDHEADKKLFGGLLQKNGLNTFQQPTIQTPKSYDERTYENKFGVANKCLPCKNSFYEGAINFKLLISDLRDKNRFENDFYYYEKYTNNLPKELVANPSMYSLDVTYSEIEKNIPFEYINSKTKEKVATTFKIGLNTRACLVNFKKIGLKTNIDEKNKKINLYLEYIYTDSWSQKIDNDTTVTENDYFIEDKYVAIKIETDNFNDFLALAKEIGIYTQVFIKIKDLFVSKINATDNSLELDFLYENCPDQIIDVIKRSEEIKEDKIWNDILLITKLDSDKFFTDTSSALINALKLIGNSDSIYQKFNKDQAFIKTIFKNLDGNSLYNGQMMSNKSIFAHFITALCIHNLSKKSKILDKEFTVGKGFAISSGSIFQEEKDDELFLQQMQNVTRTETEIRPDDLPSKVERIQVEKTKLETVGQGGLYHPMDIVHINYADSQENPFPFVSAMTIKAYAEERDQQLRADAIRIGFDVLAIVLSVAFFPVGGAIGIITESAGLGLALVDIGITASREAILQEPGGEEFLEIWDKVYFVGGLALASATIVEQAFARSAFCYLNALKSESALLQAYEKSLGEILLEREILTFAGNTLRPNTDTVLKILAYNSDKISKATGFAINNHNTILQLYEKGAILVEIGEKEYALVYKGEKLIQGTSNDKKLFEFYRDLNKNQKRLGDYLEEVLHEGGAYGESIIATTNKAEIKAFEEGLKQFSKTIAKPFEKMEEAMPYFNHYSIGIAIRQVDTTNCANVVEVIIEFLKTGRLQLAEPSGYQTFEEIIVKCGGGHFQPTTIPRMKQLMANDEIVIIYGVKEKNSITGSTSGHYFTGVKNGGELHLFDGQTGEYVVFAQTREYANFIQRGYLEFKYTKVRK